VQFQYLPQRALGLPYSGHIALYTCNSFYHFPALEYNEYRECLRLGTRRYDWEGDKPKCIRKFLYVVTIKNRMLFIL